MAQKTDLIRVRTEDKEKFVTKCFEMFLKEHPEFKGMKLSHAFIFTKLVDFYLQ